MTASKVFRPITSPITRRVSSLPPFPLKYIGASLLLGFSTDQYMAGGLGSRPDPLLFSDLITFTRSTGGGRFNAQGQYEWLPANTPRIDYDPVTGECRGLLIEEQRTNLLTYSNDFSNAAWQKESVSISSGVVQSPDGTANAAKMAEDSANSFHQIRLTTNPSATTAGVSVAVYVKADGRSRVRVFVYGTAVFTASGYAERGAYFDLSAGTVTSNDATTSSISAIGGGWYRISISQSVVAAGIFNFKVSLVSSSGATSYTGDGTSGIYIWGAQLEAGSFPTSYIPTTTAQVTRAADIASVNELSPWYNPEQGTLFVEWAHNSELVTDSKSQYVVGLFDGNALTNFVYIQRSVGKTIQSLSYVGGVDQGVINDKLAADTRSHRAAMSVSAAGRYMSVDGSSALTGPQTSMPVYDRMFIGNRWDADRAANARIRSIRYFPRALTNAELQALTA